MLVALASESIEELKGIVKYLLRLLVKNVTGNCLTWKTLKCDYGHPLKNFQVMKHFGDSLG